MRTCKSKPQSRGSLYTNTASILRLSAGESGLIGFGRGRANLCSVYVTWRYDVCEAVHFCDVSAATALTTNHHDAFVTQAIFAVNQLGKGCVALDEHGGVQGEGQLLREVFDSFRFMTSTAVREEDEGNRVFLEELQGRRGVRDGLCAADEDAVDAIGRVSEYRPSSVLTSMWD